VTTKKTVQTDAGAIVDVSGGNNGEGAFGVIIVLGTLSAGDPTDSLIGNLGLYPDRIAQGDYFAFAGGGGGGGAADGLPLPAPEPSTFGLIFCGLLVTTRVVRGKRWW
jgi:hypothetical protein